MRDPYKTLGVRQDAGADEIKAAWRTMAKAIHPDHNRDDPTATARFAEVGRAYETLKDPKKRSRYDQVSTMSASASAKGNGATIMQQRQAAREAEERAKVARANAEKVMEELARATAQKAQKAAAADASAAAAPTTTAAPQAAASSAGPAAAANAAAPETAEDMVERIFGARAAAAHSQKTAAKEKTAEQPQPETSEAVASEPELAVATGTMAAIIALPPFGILTSLVRRITGAPAPVQEKVPDIAAEAHVTLDDIIKTQWITVPLGDGKEVKFQATAGLSDGHVVHLKGQGLKLQGMVRGDVAVTVHLVPHERFTVKGYDLHTTLPITIENAVLGCEATVEGLSGQISVTVPAWSGSDYAIRIAGEGLPDDQGGKGDLVVELRLMLWEKPDHKMTDLMRSMKDGLFL